MNLDKFSKIAESLRQYRRAELKDFEKDLGSKPIESLYVDALPGDAVLKSVLSGNTTFILGRKGTGKSTVFAKAQSEMRVRKDIISVYIDVKSLLELIDVSQLDENTLHQQEISNATYRSHLLRKAMLGKIIAELLKEIGECADKCTLLDRWRGIKKQYHDLQNSLNTISDRVKHAKLETHEIPVLQKITNQIRIKNQKENSLQSVGNAKAGGKASNTTFEVNAEYNTSLTDFDKTLDDTEMYNEYSDVVLKSFPFSDIIDEIKTLISEAGLARIVIFFDDFSELNFVDQRLFVDVVLSPLNNASNESIKLKIAAYPGRVYYGKIDPSKTDTISLDFCDLYESSEVQEMELSAADYTMRLLNKRFEAFDVNLSDYFDFSNDTELSEIMKLLFQASFNVPRIIGHLLHSLYLDRISKSQKINQSAIKLASRKYYENTIEKYFDRLNRYALEPFENKLDRHNQKELLNHIVSETKEIRKKLTSGELGGTYFKALKGMIPTSHFTVVPELSEVLNSLESNFFVSRYKNMRDKNGKDVIAYALFFGLCESERMTWGYPEGRDFRHYFQQRCFEYTRAIHQFLSKNQTIKCNHCGACHPMEQKASLELYKWRCPTCGEGICEITNLSDDFKLEVQKLNKEIMLEPVEIEIVNTLHDELKKMRAGEISVLIDTTHQLVGKRTSKLQDLGLIIKERDDEDGHVKNSITQRCIDTYFKQ